MVSRHIKSLSFLSAVLVLAAAVDQPNELPGEFLFQVISAFFTFLHSRVAFASIYS